MKFHQPIQPNDNDSDALTGRLFFEPPSNIERNYAFSWRTKVLIYDRANSKCEFTGWGHLPLNAAHLNHSRQSGYYDDPSNGLLVCLPLHLAHHIKFKGNASVIGLSETHNNFAIDSLAERVLNYQASKGLWRPADFAEEKKLLRNMIDEVMHFWEEFYISVES